MASGYSSSELNEFSYSLAVLRGEKEQTADKIKEVMNMGWFSRLRDSKVPKEKRWLFHWFSLQVSNKNVLAEELEKFEDFFEDIEKGITKLKNGEEGDADELLNELYDKLLKYHRYAKSRINKDNSKTMSKYHEGFVDKGDMLENTVRRVECARNRREVRKLRDELGAVSKQLTELQTKLDKTIEMKEDLANELKKSNETQKETVEQQKKLREENNLMKTCLTNFIREQQEQQEKYQEQQEKYHRNMEKTINSLVSMNKELLEENRNMKNLLKQKNKTNEESGAAGI